MGGNNLEQLCEQKCKGHLGQLNQFGQQFGLYFVVLFPPVSGSADGKAPMQIHKQILFLKYHFQAQKLRQQIFLQNLCHYSIRNTHRLYIHKQNVVVPRQHTDQFKIADVTVLWGIFLTNSYFSNTQNLLVSILNFRFQVYFSNLSTFMDFVLLTVTLKNNHNFGNQLKGMYSGKTVAAYWGKIQLNNPRCMFFQNASLSVKHNFFCNESMYSKTQASFIYQSLPYTYHSLQK